MSKASVIKFIREHYSDDLISFQPSERLFYEIQPEIPDRHKQAMIDFYNLEYAKDKEVYKFIEEYLFDTSFSETGDPDIDKNYRDKIISDTIALYDGLKAELPVFQTIVDKVITGTELIEEIELKKVKEFVGYSNFVQKQFEDRWMLMLLDDPKSEFLKAVYSVVIGISQGIVCVRRCGLKNCKKLFIPYKSGHGQTYCNDNHRQRAFILKKRLT